MELILWRHAEAEDANPGGDFKRELTKKGRKQAERMAQWLRPKLESTLMRSPLMRTTDVLPARCNRTPC